MFFLDDLKNIKKEGELYKYIIQAQKNLKNIEEIQYAKKNILAQILDKIANIDESKIDITKTKSLLYIIEDTKESLDRINDSLFGINGLLDRINSIINRINEFIDKNIFDEALFNDIEYFYVIYSEKINMLTEADLAYERIIQDAIFYTTENIANTI